MKRSFVSLKIVGLIALGLLAGCNHPNPNLADQAQRAQDEADQTARLAQQAVADAHREKHLSQAIRANQEEASREQAGRLEDMNAAVPVSLIAVGAKVSDGTSPDQMLFKMGFKNTTDKVVSGVRGAGVIKDEFGDTLTTLNITMPEKIQPGATAIWNGVLNLDPNDTKIEALKQANRDRLALDFQPAGILFADGSQMTSSGNVDAPAPATSTP